MAKMTTFLAVSIMIAIPAFSQAQGAGGRAAVDPHIPAHGPRPVRDRPLAAAPGPDGRAAAPVLRR